MSSYTKELKARRKTNVLRMSAIVGDGRRSLTTSERAEFDRLDNDVRSIDVQVANSKTTDYRGMDGRKIRRTEADGTFSDYLRGRTSTPPQFGIETRAGLDANSMTTGGVEPGVAGPTGYSSGYMIPQSFWSNLTVAMKAYGGMSNAFGYIETPTGAPMPWAATDPTNIKASYITETNQLGFGGDSAGSDYQFGQGI